MRLRGDDMKPTYEELEATNEVLRKALENIEAKTCADFIGEDEIKDFLNELWLIARNATPEKAGYVILARLETLEKALDMVCGKIDSCPSKIEFMKCNLRLNESKCRDCRRVYFINKAGGSK
jgi:hypothetical protein